MATNQYQTAAIGSNLAAMPQVEQLTQLINQLNQNAQQTANSGRIPGGQNLESISSGNISRALSGELDPSVINQLATASAERGSRTGSPMGPSTNAAYLKSLGLNSLDLMNQGQGWLTQATGRNPGAPITDPSRFLLSPSEQANIALREQELQLQRDSLNRQKLGGGDSGGGSGRMPLSQPSSYDLTALFSPSVGGRGGVTDAQTSSSFPEQNYYDFTTDFAGQDPFAWSAFDGAPATPNYDANFGGFNGFDNSLGMWGDIGTGSLNNPDFNNMSDAAFWDMWDSY